MALPIDAGPEAPVPPLPENKCKISFVDLAQRRITEKIKQQQKYHAVHWKEEPAPVPCPMCGIFYGFGVPTDNLIPCRISEQIPAVRQIRIEESRLFSQAPYLFAGSYGIISVYAVIYANLDVWKGATTCSRKLSLCWTLVASITS